MPREFQVYRNMVFEKAIISKGALGQPLMYSSKALTLLSLTSIQTLFTSQMIKRKVELNIFIQGTDISG